MTRSHALKRSNKKNNSRSKNIDKKFHCIRHLKENGMMKLEYYPNKERTADIITMPFSGLDFKFIDVFSR